MELQKRWALGNRGRLAGFKHKRVRPRAGPGPDLVLSFQRGTCKYAAPMCSVVAGNTSTGRRGGCGARQQAVRQGPGRPAVPEQHPKVSTKRLPIRRVQECPWRCFSRIGLVQMKGARSWTRRPAKTAAGERGSPSATYLPFTRLPAYRPCPTAAEVRVASTRSGTTAVWVWLGVACAATNFVRPAPVKAAKKNGHFRHSASPPTWTACTTPYSTAWATRCGRRSVVSMLGGWPTKLHRPSKTGLATQGGRMEIVDGGTGTRSIPNQNMGLQVTGFPFACHPHAAGGANAAMLAPRCTFFFVSPHTVAVFILFIFWGGRNSSEPGTT